MIITTFKNQYNATPEQARLAEEAMVNGGVVKLLDQGVSINGTTIQEIAPGEIETKLQYGKWKCSVGHIHPKEDGYCGLGDINKSTLALPDESDAMKEQKYLRARAAGDEVRKKLAKKLSMK